MHLQDGKDKTTSQISEVLAIFTYEALDSASSMYSIKALILTQWNI